MSKIFYVVMLLFAIACSLTIMAITVHNLNVEISNLLWGSSLGGLTDVERYVQWEWIMRICTVVAILFYGSGSGLLLGMFHRWAER